MSIDLYSNSKALIINLNFARPVGWLPRVHDLRFKHESRNMDMFIGILLRVAQTFVDDIEEGATQNDGSNNQDIAEEQDG